MPSSKPKTVKDLNPRSTAVKTIEMAVVRTLGLIGAFDELDKGEDWTDVPPATYRRVLGKDGYRSRFVIAEVWKRYKEKTIYSEIMDLYANLPPSAQKRKEIKSGIANVRSKLDS